MCGFLTFFNKVDGKPLENSGDEINLEKTKEFVA